MSEVKRETSPSSMGSLTMSSSSSSSSSTSDMQLESNDAPVDIVTYIKRLTPSDVPNQVKHCYDLLCGQEGDYTLLLDGNTDIKVESQIMKTGSGFFKVFVKGSFSEKETKELDFTAYPKEMVVRIILYIYCRIYNKPADVKKMVLLLKYTSLFLLDEYSQLLEDDLKSTTIPSNVFERLKMFDAENIDNLVLFCMDLITKEYKSNILEDQMCYDSGRVVPTDKCIGSENQIVWGIRRSPKHRHRLCCCHDNEGKYPDPPTEYKYKQQTPCYYYTLHHQAIPDDAYVGFCCCHRHKKFYDNVSQLPNKYKILLMDKLRG